MVTPASCNVQHVLMFYLQDEYYVIFKMFMEIDKKKKELLLVVDWEVCGIVFYNMINR